MFHSLNMLLPARHIPSIQRKNYHIAPLMHNDVITKQTPSAINVQRTLLRLIPVAVSGVTHPPVLSALLLIHSASSLSACKKANMVLNVHRNDKAY